LSRRHEEHEEHEENEYSQNDPTNTSPQELHIEVDDQGEAKIRPAQIAHRLRNMNRVNPVETHPNRCLSEFVEIGRHS